MFTNFVHNAAREIAVQEMQATQGTNFIDPRPANSQPTFLMKKVYTVAAYFFSFFKSFNELVDSYAGKNDKFINRFENITRNQEKNVKKHFDSMINKYKTNRHQTAVSMINSTKYLSEKAKEELVAQLGELAKMADVGQPLKATYTASKADGSKHKAIRDIEEQDFNKNWITYMEQVKGIIDDKQRQCFPSRKVDAKQDIANARKSNKVTTGAVDTTKITKTFLSTKKVAESLSKKEAGPHEKKVSDELKAAKKLFVKTPEELQKKDDLISKLKKELPKAIKKDREAKESALKSKCSVGYVRSAFEQHPKKTAMAAVGALGALSALGYYLYNPATVASEAVCAVPSLFSPADFAQQCLPKDGVLGGVVNTTKDAVSAVPGLFSPTDFAQQSPPNDGIFGQAVNVVKQPIQEVPQGFSPKVFVGTTSEKASKYRQLGELCTPIRLQTGKVVDLCVNGVADYTVKAGKVTNACVTGIIFAGNTIYNQVGTLCKVF